MVFPSGSAEIIRVLQKRRSVRKYQQKPIPKEDLEALLFALQRAPTDATAQLYSTVRITDKDLRRWISEKTGNPHVLEAAEFFLFLGDLYRVRRFLEKAGYPPGRFPKTGLHFALIDASLSAAFMALTAESLGYGICFIGGVLNAYPEITEALALPEGVFPVVGLTVGVPAEDGPPRPRLPRGLVVHENRYRTPEEEELEEGLQAMAPIARGDWARLLARYFAQGGAMEAREAPYGKTLTRQGLDPDLPKEAGAYSLGALIEEALSEWRSVLFRRGEAWVEKEDEAQRGEGRPGEALLQALSGAGFPGL